MRAMIAGRIEDPLSPSGPASIEGAIMDRDYVDPLFARADRAIEESQRLRGEVRRGLDRATMASARMRRSLDSLSALSRDPTPARSSAPWTMAPLRAARPADIIQRDDAELRLAWRRALPLIETPLNLFRR